MSKTRKQIVLETLKTLADMLGDTKPTPMSIAFGLTDDDAFDFEADAIQEAICGYRNLRNLYDEQTKSLALQAATIERLQSSLEAEKSSHAKACELLSQGANEIDRLRVDLKAASCDLDRARHFLTNAEKACAEWHERADKLEAQRDTAIRDTAAALRVVRLMASDRKEN